MANRRTLASDEFNRGTVGLGARWTEYRGLFNLRINSNQVDANSPGFDGDVVYIGTSFPADQWAQCTLKNLNVPALGEGYGLAIRADAATHFGYRVVVSDPGGAGDNIEIASFTPTYTLIATRRYSPVVSGDVLRVEMEGTTMRVYINDVQLGADITNSAISSGAPGMGHSSTTSAGNIDNWSAGDFVTDTVINFPIAANDDDGTGYWAKSSWPPSPSETTFTDLSSDALVYVDKDHVTDANGTYHQKNGYLRWDTSSLPDNATIVSARIRIYTPLGEIGDADGTYSIQAAYQNWGGAPVVTGDYVQTPTPAMTPLDISTLDVGTHNELVLTDFSGINLSGYTEMVITLTSGTPSSTTVFNYVGFESKNAAAGNPAILQLTYTAPSEITNEAKLRKGISPMNWR